MTPHGPALDAPTLARLLAPVDVRTFVEEHWEKRPLHVRAEDPDRFRALLRVSDIDAVLTGLGPKFPDFLSMVSATRKIATHEYCYPSGLCNAAHVYKLYREGATLILPSLHRFVPRLNRLCRELEAELTGRVQTNIYMTPPGSQGFPTHFDNHDVLCLQVFGQKRWRLYARNRELVFPGEEFNVQVDDPGECTAELVTGPGDALYLPRGTMHSAHTTEHESLHITVGYFTVTWAQLLIEAVSQVALSHDALRGSLPLGYGQPGADVSGVLARVPEPALGFGLVQRP